MFNTRYVYAGKMNDTIKTSESPELMAFKCACVRERERERVCVCVRERQRERVSR